MNPIFCFNFNYILKFELSLFSIPETTHWPLVFFCINYLRNAWNTVQMSSFFDNEMVMNWNLHIWMLTV